MKHIKKYIIIGTIFSIFHIAIAKDENSISLNSIITNTGNNFDVHDQEAANWTDYTEYLKDLRINDREDMFDVKDRPTDFSHIDLISKNYYGGISTVGYHDPLHTEAMDIHFKEESEEDRINIIQSCVLTNNTSEEQLLSCSSFSEKFQERNSSTTTNSHKEVMGLEQKFKVGFPVIGGETTVKASFEVDTSTSNTTTEMKTLEFKSSAQTIKVPAGEVAEVHTRFSIIKGGGSVTIKREVENPTMKLFVHSRGSSNFSQAAPMTKFLDNYPSYLDGDLISFDVENNKIFLLTEVDYEVEAGSEMFVEVRFRDSKPTKKTNSRTY